jgi:hypothetical protein|tara:strand:+ start:160 stop:435 length:276 start_codon:yes stop_codon:yes gene_type:complete
MAELSRTARFYKENKAARLKKAAYQKEFNKKPEQRKKRSELTMLNRKMGKKGDGKDVSHTSKGVVLKSQSINRASKSDSAGDKRARGTKSK